jgi:hypothetical protein
MGHNSGYYKILQLEHNSIDYRLKPSGIKVKGIKNSSEVITLKTFTIFDTDFSGVFEITDEGSNLKFWLKQNMGLIAFEKDSIKYKLN